MLAVCVWARVWERPERCVGLLSQEVEREKEILGRCLLFVSPGGLGGTLGNAVGSQRVGKTKQFLNRSRFPGL